MMQTGDINLSLNEVKIALNVVYSLHSNAAARREADSYLTTFQTLPIAWIVCDRILQEDTSLSDSCSFQQSFFAAQTLHTKCRRDISQIPSETFPSLMNSFTQHIARFHSSDLLSSRLAMGLSALAVQMGWFTLLDDLLSTSTSPHVLPVFQAIPEECASDRLRPIHRKNRFTMRDHLISSSVRIFEFLENRAQTITAMVLRVFCVWVRYVPVHPEVLQRTSLVPIVFQTLLQPEFMELSADIIVEILRMYPSHNFANQGLTQDLIPHISQLPLVQALESENEDILTCFCRIVTETGESYLNLLLSDRYTAASQLMEWIIQCSSVEEVEIAVITLHFWYRFVTELEMVEPLRLRQQLVDVYSPQLAQLIEICITKLMMFPSEDYHHWKSDDFRRHRLQVDDTLQDCARLIGADMILLQLKKFIEAEVKTFRDKWRGLESSLACLCAINRYVAIDERSVLPLVFSLIPQIPENNAPLRAIFVQLCGSFSLWVVHHPTETEVILPFLANEYCQSDLTQTAAFAIKELCACKQEHKSFLAFVLSVLDSPRDGSDFASDCYMIEAACLAVSQDVSLKQDDSRELLVRLASPIIARLQRSDVLSKQQVLSEISKLTILIREYPSNSGPQDSHPIFELVRSSWLLLSHLTESMKDDFQASETICRFHKHAMRSSGIESFKELLPQLSLLILQCFVTSLQSPFLYLASVVVREYANYPNEAYLVLENTSKMLQTVQMRIDLKNIAELRIVPDVVEEVFYLLSRTLACLPHYLLQSQPDGSSASFQVEVWLEHACVGVTLNHREAHKAVISFLNEVLNFVERSGPSDAKMTAQAAVDRVGQCLTYRAMKAAFEDDLLFAQERALPGLLWRLQSIDHGVFLGWMKAALESMTNAPSTAKSEFFEAVKACLPQDEFFGAFEAFRAAIIETQ